MDRRRLGWTLGLVAAVIVIALLAFFNNRGDDDETATTAFAPARSANESVPVPDEPLAVEAPAEEEPEQQRVVILAPEEAAGTETAAPEVVATEEPATPVETETASEPPAEPTAEPATEVADAPEPEPVVGEEIAAAEPPVAPEPAPLETDTMAEATPASGDEVMETPVADAPGTADVVEPETVEVAALPEADEGSNLTGATRGTQIEVAPAPDVVQPEVEITPLAPTAIVPSFDVVRVEPSGDVVIAGTAAPGADVEVLDGVATIATAQANAGGEWALALDQPLSPGTHDLSIRTRSPNRAEVALSDQRVAVSVPETGGDEVLVVVSEAGEASEVLQVPAAEATEIAAAEPPPEAVVEAAPAEETVVAALEEPAASATEPMTETTEPETAAVAEAPAETTPVESPAVTEPETAVAAAEPVEPATPVEPAEPVITHAVAVTAVEADSAGALFVAGTAETDEPVRVYLDDELIGQAAPTAGGTWLVETQREVPAGAYRVRADQVGTGGEVLVRAEVPFQREIEVATLAPVVETGAATGTQVAGEVPQLRTVIIKRGDNLWRISRAIYGRGIRYSTIYEANRDQIRNPRWIYPGQVFVLPEGNTDWTE